MSNLTTCLLVPCFNAERYIEAFIKNISQLFIPFDEVLFYDDGSTDGTAKLLSQQKIGTVIYGKENYGPSIARNILLRHSKSQLVHFHDVDDWLEPSFLSVTIENLTDQWDVVITNIKVIDRETGKHLHVHDYSNLSTYGDPVKFFLTHTCYPINGLYRREVLENIGGFRESLSRDEDPDLHIRLAYSGARITNVPLPLAINRFGEGTYSSNSYLNCWREHLKALNYYVDERPQIYHSILSKDSARMVYLCAASGDLQLAQDYLAFSLSIQGNKDLIQSASRFMKILIKVLGFQTALNVRFGIIGQKLRKLYPWRIG